MEHCDDQGGEETPSTRRAAIDACGLAMQIWERVRLPVAALMVVFCIAPVPYRGAKDAPAWLLVAMFALAAVALPFEVVRERRRNGS
jgi:hypothetical protein